MKHGDYDDVVGHCRSALELMSDAVPAPPSSGGRPPSFRQKVDHLFTVMGASLSEDHQRRLPEIINALWGLTSRAVHPHSLGIFTRADAECLMLMTTASLAYIGRLLKSNEAGTGAVSPPTP
jgi:hypothetical protein